eukprot:7120076-Prymnesium_polylepis.1
MSDRAPKALRSTREGGREPASATGTLGHRAPRLRRPSPNARRLGNQGQCAGGGTQPTKPNTQHTVNQSEVILIVGVSAAVGRG